MDTARPIGPSATEQEKYVEILSRVVNFMSMVFSAEKVPPVEKAIEILGSDQSTK